MSFVTSFLRKLSIYDGCALMLFGAIVVSSPVSANKVVDIGPQPDWESARAAAEKVARINMLDPDAAQLQWPNQRVLRGRKAWFVCGLINGKNSYGAYTGFTQFSVGFVNGRSVSFRMSPGSIGYGMTIGLNECSTDRSRPSGPMAGPTLAPR